MPLRSTEYNVRVQPVRLIFDLSFYIIIILIGLNIVFGIIVDTFGELREERVWNDNTNDINYNDCHII